MNICALKIKKKKKRNINTLKFNDCIIYIRLAEVSNREIKKTLTLTLFGGVDFENHLNLVVSKLNHTQNDNFDGLTPFVIIFKRPSFLLVSQETSTHENLVSEMSYIYRTK